MPTHIDEEDVNSTFSAEDGDPFTFNVTELELLVSKNIGKPCRLRKLGEGGYHKVYDIVVPGEEIVSNVVRVAAPDFPVDKLESEVATMKHIAADTSVRVPKVLLWSSDASNSAGVEYMIIEKIPGVCAYDVWNDLKLEAKETLVRQVAKSLVELFSLRFSKAGSLYLKNGTSIEVGPVVAGPFYRSQKGEVRFPDAEPLDLSEFRGPFTRASEYLSSLVKSELYIIKHRRSEVLKELEGDEARLECGERVLEKLSRLVEIYPGDTPLGLRPSSDQTRPFSLRLEDFALPNIMIDPETGNVTGLIDFEATTTAPLWWCTGFPWWLGEADGGEADENQTLIHLQDVYNEAIKACGELGEEYKAADDQGEWFRQMADRLSHNVYAWAHPDHETWVDERLAFAAKFPGMGLRERTIEEDAKARYGVGPDGEPWPKDQLFPWNLISG